MTFADDERGQPVVIGALLIFTILILAFAGYQAFAVPNQNAEVEFNHFQDVQSDFGELESNLVNAIESGDTRSVSIDLGPQYPTRMIALNPPPAAGTLRTTEAGEVAISGTSESICRDGGTPTSRSLVYQPGYAEFDNAESIVYENRFTTRQFREGSVFGEQRLVESRSGNDRINLLLLTGDVSENGIGVSNVEIDATSRYSTTVNNPTITLPSRFSDTEWNNDILAGRGDVTAAENGDRIDLSFSGGDYTVSCAVAGLNSEPAFSPPAVGNDEGDGGTDAAYSTEWLSPNGRVGTSSCSSTDCTLDASTSMTLDLTAETNPVAEEAPVEFAVNNTSVGTVSQSSANTGANGEVTTTLEAQSDGSVKAYVFSGGSGDSINITVENFPPGGGLGSTVVFTGSNQKITTADQSGTTAIDQKAKAIGPLIADIDGDGTDEIPYVKRKGNDERITIVNPDGSDETEISNVAARDPSVLAVGQWGSDPISVYFAGSLSSTIYRTNADSLDTPIATPSNGVSAVAGPAEIDGDGNEELVYIDDSSALRYFDDKGDNMASGTKISFTNGIGSNNGIGVGRPADFDGDGTARIPVVDGSNRLVLVDSNGNVEVLVSSGVEKAPVAPVDWDEDGELELVYLEGNNLKYVDNVSGSQTTVDTGINGLRTKTGAA
jgi:hypothetical protein